MDYTELQEKFELTKREMALVKLVRSGRTNDEIGLTLNITRSTVKFHLTRLKRKMGVKNRYGLIIWAMLNLPASEYDQLQGTA